MSNQVLYRKWRPQNLSEVVGQQHITRTLGNALTSGKVAHAYLFCGPRGTGKTSTARIMAKAVNCPQSVEGAACNQCPICESFAAGRAMDLVEIDAASNRGIDDIRSLRDKVNYAPSQCKYRVYIVDEVHMLTNEAFNALLKTLEEPPPHAIFILATTEPHRVPATISSRCQRYDFRRIPRSALIERLQLICREESMEPETGVLDLVAATATGSLRDALNILEQMMVSYGPKTTLAEAQALLNISGDPRALDFLGRLIKHDVKGGISLLIDVTEDGVEPRHFGRDITELLRAMLLIKTGAGKAVDLDEEMVAALQGLAAEAEVDDISSALRLFAKLDYRQEHPPSLPLELAFLEHCDRGRLQASNTVPAPARTAAQPSASAPAPVHERAPSRDSAPPPVQRRDTPVAPPMVERGPRLVDNGQGYSLEQIAAAVKEVRIPANKFVEALLRTGCIVEGIREDTVTLGFKHQAHKERVEQPNNLKLAEAALKQLLGKGYRLQCKLIDSSNGGQSTQSGGHLLRAAMDMGGKVREQKQEDFK